ncbi:hypothetical protein IWX63_003355, partial [Arthrobacter sp. CAN_A2]
ELPSSEGLDLYPATDAPHPDHSACTLNYQEPVTVRDPPHGD